MRVVTALILCLAAACGDGSAPAADAGTDAGDASPGNDAGNPEAGPVPLVWVDFTASGCELDETADPPTCVGSAPLTVTFSPLAPSPVTSYRWLFGDDEEAPADVRPAPSYTYVEPGTYDVSLEAAGPGGTAREAKANFLVVTSSGLGQACISDDACTSGTCLCDDEDCGPIEGFCADSCDDSCDDGVCVDLSDGPTPLQPTTCLADCDASACPIGTTCQSLVAATGGLVRGCLAPGLFSAIGQSCALPDGGQSAELCSTGQCTAEGAFGLCTASCEDSPCPAGSTCADFNGDLGFLCLAECGTEAPCNTDPWLSCEDPGGSGDKAFAVTGDASDSGYCAPKPCAVAAECPGGTCTDGFCASAD